MNPDTGRNQPLCEQTNSGAEMRLPVRTFGSDAAQLNDQDPFGFPFLRGKYSLPAFLSEPNMQSAVESLIMEGKYYDLATRLKTLLHQVLPLSDDALRFVVQELQEFGRIKLQNKATLSTLLSDVGVEYLRDSEIQRVTNMLLPVLKGLNKGQDEALKVAKVLLEEAQDKAEGVVISCWSKSVCPSLYGPPDEQRIVEFLNNTCRWVDEYLVKMNLLPSQELLELDRLKWVSTGMSHMQPISGVTASSKTSGADTRRPDVILVAGNARDPYQWSDVISVVDIQDWDSSDLCRRSMEYMVEVSRLVFTNQVDRRFFIGVLLSGSQLRIALIARGSAAFTEPIDIHSNPAKYMQVLSWFMHTRPRYLGYDTRYKYRGAPATNPQLWLQLDSNEGQVLTEVKSIMCNRIARSGCSSSVMVVKVIPTQLKDRNESLIVQEVWQHMSMSSDGEIHRLLEDKGRIQSFQNKLRISYLGVIPDTVREREFPKILYRRWNSEPDWDGEGEKGSFPRHIPVRHQRMSIMPVMTTDCDTGKQVPDNVANIMKGMVSSCYPLVHYRTVFKTNAVRCTWFSCRREFFSGLVGALKGHLHAWRRGLMNGNISDGSTWLWVPAVDPVYAVPSWCAKDGETEFQGQLVTDPEWFPMRPGIAGDFGLALDFLKDEVRDSRWTTTARGNFPYNTTDNTSPPSICHDLESYIYLAFVIGVNFTGPYHQQQVWPVPSHHVKGLEIGITTPAEASDTISHKYGLPSAERKDEYKQFPGEPSLLRHPQFDRGAEPVSEEERSRLSMVPQWAKLGVYEFDTDDAIWQKEGLTWDTLKASLHPYWKVGNMMTAWKKIYDLLWPSPAEKRLELTHVKLISILQDMVDKVPAIEDGAPEKSVVDAARVRFRASLTNPTSPSSPFFSSPPPPHLSSSIGVDGFQYLAPTNVSVQSSRYARKRKTSLSQGSDTSSVVSISPSGFSSSSSRTYDDT